MSPLFGRDRQLAELTEHLESVAAGHGGMVLLAGEAGVGKSRLLSDALDTAEAASCVQIRLNCLEGDEAEPYSLARSLMVAAGHSAAELPAEPAPEAERQVRRVQQALLPMLRGVRGEQPLLILVEDIHWSDGPSLQLLLGLALLPDPQLFLLSYRPTPVTPVLQSFLAEVSRLRLGATIHLPPLSASDTARLIRAMLGLREGSLPPALLHEVMAATDGIPYLVEELIHTLLEQGDLQQDDTGWRFRRGSAIAVPGSLRHAIEGRLLRLPPEVITVAEQAAVFGQIIDIPRLARLARLDEDELFAALHALIKAQILAEQSDGTIAFRHALTRETIRTRLLRPERQTLHRRVAQMLEAEGGAAASTLAYHWSRAGETTRAAQYAWQAARRASALHAYHEAITHYELALLAEGAAKPAAEEEILGALGDQHQALGDNERAITYYKKAQAIYRAAADATAVALLDLSIGVVCGEQRVRTQALAHLQNAFDRLPQDHPRRWLAGLYLGLQQAASGDHQAAEATFLAAQEAAGATTLAQLRIAYELGGLRARRGDWAALEEAAERLLRDAPDDSDEALALRHDAHAGLGSVGYYRGELAATLHHFEACLRVSEQRGLVNDQLLARWNLASNALYHIGRWHEAREQLAVMQTLALDELAQAAIIFEMWLNGQWEEAVAIWMRAWPQMVAGDDLEVQMAFGRRIADLLLALDRPRDAVHFLEPVLERLRQVDARSFELQLVPRQAEALARAGDDRALQVAARGLELAQALGGRPAQALLLRARAIALQNAGQWLDAFADFEAGIAILEEIPMPYEAARTLRQAGLARLARGRRGDRKRGAKLLRRAREQFADLGATRDENATEAILSAAGLAAEQERQPGPLTVREQAVAELVAQGLSNAEIAERLFIAEKTAAYHVGSILTKLDFTSRVQIAVYVTEMDRGQQTADH